MEIPELERHRRALEGRLRRTLGAAEAAELTQEAVARALERPPADGRTGPWLERIARNLLIDRWRRMRRQAGALRAFAPDDEVVAHELSPEEILLRAERRRQARQAVARLPRPQRRAVCARFGAEGCEAAAATTRTRLHRALLRLRDQLGGLRVALLGPGGSLTGALAPATLGVLLVTAAPTTPPTATPVVVAQATRSPARPARPTNIVVPPTTAAAPTPRRVQQPKRVAPPPAPQRMDFEDDEVTGELAAPDQVVVSVPTAAPKPSLIEIPSSFLHEIVKDIAER